MFKKLFVVGLAVLFILPAIVFSKDEMQGKNMQNSKMGEQKTFEGTLVCVKCDLKQEAGARSDCKLYGHEYAIKTADGKYIEFFENKYSEPLLKGDEYANKNVKVTGTYYPSANLIDVSSFTVDGKENTWCDHHQKMDTCGMMMHK